MLEIPPEIINLGTRNLITIVVFALALIQMLIAFFTLNSLKRLKSETRQIRSLSKTTAADILEKYSKIFNPISITVNSNIQEVAIAKDSHIFMNKRLAYNDSIYTIIYLCKELILTNKRHQPMQSSFAQKFFYFFQVILGLSAIYFSSYILLGLYIFVFIGLVVSGYYRQESFNIISKKTIELASDLANLTDEEIFISKKILRSLSSKYKIYPLSAISSLINFFSFK